MQSYTYFIIQQTKKNKKYKELAANASFCYFRQAKNIKMFLPRTFRLMIITSTKWQNRKQGLSTDGRRNF